MIDQNIYETCKNCRAPVNPWPCNISNLPNCFYKEELKKEIEESLKKFDWKKVIKEI